MADKRDYYEILNVSRTADEITIKKAFRQLALEYHPDRNGTAEAAEKFREAQEAYEILSDSEKRGLYDQFGHRGVSGRSTGFGGGDMGDVFAGFQSIFDDFFGGSARAETRGADLLYRLEIDFREAILGCSKTIEIPRSHRCETCDGSGVEPGKKAETCTLCQGRGKISKNQGFFIMSQTCPQCGGEGKIIKYPCKDCKGKGQKAGKHKVEVKVPAGVDTGVRLRLSHEGDLSPNGREPGDLYVELTVKPDEVFERDGVDLYTKVYIPYPIAMLGGEAEIPLIEGSKTIKVPHLMHSPHRIVLKHEGVKDLRRNHRGDLIVEMHIDTPTELSSKAKELIEQLKTELETHTKKEDDTSKKKKKKGLFS
ncbi:MAG: dnaJ [Bacteriovoracaceae bacterium]|nr:dnaJ [Bacteriovoracaceae bacterium]